VILVAIIISQIIPPEPPNIHYFNANPSTIIRGQSSTLTWGTSNAMEAEISHIGGVPLSGSRRVSPERTTSYTLIAINEEGNRVEEEVTVEVIETEPPKIHSFEADPSVIKEGKSSTLRWGTSNAEEVEISGIGRVSLSDSRRVSPERTTSYTLIAINEEGNRVEEEVTVEVIETEPPKIHYFEADPSVIKEGKSSTLRWETSNAEEVEISGIGRVSLSGEREVSPERTTTHTLIAINEEGNRVEKEVTVEVIITDTTPPTIIGNTPTGTNVPVNTQINITFSEAMNLESAQSVFSTSPATTGRFRWDGNTMIYTLSSNLAYRTSYTVTIGTGARDFAGNGLQSPHSQRFTTASAPDTPPTVIGNTPTGSNVPVTTQITMTFSEAMDQASVQTAFSTSPATKGSFRWDGNTLIYTPSLNLAYRTRYTVTVGTGARDFAGNGLQSPHRRQFITVSALGTDLVVTTLETTGPPTVNPEGSVELPIRVEVKNQGDAAAGIFKVATEYTGPQGTFVVAFTVPGQSSSWYPYTSASLAAGSVVNFAGKVTFRPKLRGVTVSLKATADSCSGDEFMPDYCRVEESNEGNNEATAISVSLPH
jgi:hypothetical protein